MFYRTLNVTRVHDFVRVDIQKYKFFGFLVKVCFRENTV